MTTFSAALSNKIKYFRNSLSIFDHAFVRGELFIKDDIIDEHSSEVYFEVTATN